MKDYKLIKPIHIIEWILTVVLLYYMWTGVEWIKYMFITEIIILRSIESYSKYLDGIKYALDK